MSENKKKLFVRALETGRKASFLSVSQRVLMNLISSDNVCILCLSCNVKKHKIMGKLSKKSRNKCCSNPFVWCPLSNAYLTVAQHKSGTRKLYLGQQP